MSVRERINPVPACGVWCGRVSVSAPRLFVFDIDAITRIKEYEKSYRYAMEISEFQETTEISLDDLKQDFPDFVVPKSYIYLDKNPKLLKYIEDRLTITGKKVIHDFSSITDDQICIN